MEDVTTRELLGAGALNLIWVGGIPDMHILSANDADVLMIELLPRSIWVLIHILEGLAVTNECVESLQARSRCHEPVPDDVDRETKEGKEDAEEGRVDAELDDVWEP